MKRNPMLKIVNRLQKEAGQSMDVHIRDILKAGSPMAYTGNSASKVSKFIILKNNITVKIKEIRKSLAEWIGGDDLHEYCDY